jgi:hypothetical protein
MTSEETMPNEAHDPNPNAEPARRLRMLSVFTREHFKLRFRETLTIELHKCLSTELLRAIFTMKRHIPAWLFDLSSLPEPWDRVDLSPDMD